MGLRRLQNQSFGQGDLAVHSFHLRVPAPAAGIDQAFTHDLQLVQFGHHGDDVVVFQLQAGGTSHQLIPLKLAQLGDFRAERLDFKLSLEEGLLAAHHHAVLSRAEIGSWGGGIGAGGKPFPHDAAFSFGFLHLQAGLVAELFLLGDLLAQHGQRFLFL